MKAAVTSSLIEIPGEQLLTHELQSAFKEIAKIRNRAELLRSAIYAEHKAELDRLENGLEWSNLHHTDQAPAKIRVAHWNIERGKNLDGILHFIKTHPVLAEADVLLVTEADIGMGRSGNKNIPREIAEHLGMNYAFANSFICFDKGDESEQDHDLESTMGLHGVAILSKFRIQSIAAVSLPMMRDTFVAREKRLGGRRSLVARVQVGNREIDFAVVHLDLHASPKQRAWQLESLLQALSSQGLFHPERGQVVGGDFNSCTLDLRNPFALAKDLLLQYSILGVDGKLEELMRPDKRAERHIFRTLAEYGFSIDGLNDLTRGTLHCNLYDTHSVEKAHKFMPKRAYKWVQKQFEPYEGKVPLRLDWFAARNLPNMEDAPHPAVLPIPDSYAGKPLSDHCPIVVDLPL